MLPRTSAHPDQAYWIHFNTILTLASDVADEVGGDDGKVEWDGEQEEEKRWRPRFKVGSWIMCSVKAGEMLFPVVLPLQYVVNIWCIHSKK